MNVYHLGTETINDMNVPSNAVREERNVHVLYVSTGKVDFLQLAGNLYRAMFIDTVLNKGDVVLLCTTKTKTELLAVQFGLEGYRTLSERECHDAIISRVEFNRSRYRFEVAIGPDMNVKGIISRETEDLEGIELFEDSVAELLSGVTIGEYHELQAKSENILI